MSKQRFISVLEIDPVDRADILKLLIPRHPNLYFRHVTEAYDVGRHHQVPQVDRVMALGLIETDRVQAFLVSVLGRTHREDGRPFHITVTCADGVAPAEAGSVDPGRAIAFEGAFPITVIPCLKPRWQMIPERLSA